MSGAFILRERVGICLVQIGSFEPHSVPEVGAKSGRLYADSLNIGWLYLFADLLIQGRLGVPKYLQ